MEPLRVCKYKHQGCRLYPSHECPLHPYNVLKKSMSEMRIRAGSCEARGPEISHRQFMKMRREVMQELQSPLVGFLSYQDD